MSDDADDKPKEYTAKEIAERFAAIGKPSDGPVTGELIDATTRAELEKWFTLPSFAQVAEGDLPKAPQVAPEREDPEMVAVRTRREKAIERVQPELLAAIEARAAARSTPFRERPPIELKMRAADDMALADLEAIERAHRIAEPREVEMPPEMEDDMKACAPQALLRDLHRPETEFDKTFEVIDMAADQKLDIVALVNEVMRTAWGVTAADVASSPKREATEIIAELRAERQNIPWPTLWKQRPLPNRKVSE